MQDQKTEWATNVSPKPDVLVKVVLCSHDRNILVIGLNVLESHLHQNKVYNYVDLVKEDVDADFDRSTRWKLSSLNTVEEKFAEEDQ